jgi:tetratricopeptide (TPR) repeat protein
MKLFRSVVAIDGLTSNASVHFGNIRLVGALTISFFLAFSNPSQAGWQKDRVCQGGCGGGCGPCPNGAPQRPYVAPGPSPEEIQRQQQVARARTYYDAAQIAFQGHDYNRAAQLYSQAYAIDPRPYYLGARYNAEGAEARQSGHYDRAIELFDQANAADPSQVYLDNKRGAIDDKNRALANDFSEAAKIAFKQGDYNRTAQLYGQAYAIDPRPYYLAEKYNAEGLAERRLGHYDRAVELFDQANAANPSQAYLDNKRGAIDEKNRALAKNYGDAAEVASRAGNYNRAVELYDQAYAAHPWQGYLDSKNLVYAEWFEKAAYNAMQSGDYSAAINFYDGAYRAHPSQAYLDKKKMAVLQQTYGYVSTASFSSAFSQVSSYATSVVATYISPKCEGMFCTHDNPKNPDIENTDPKTQTKYPSASAQGDAIVKDPKGGGCVFDGGANCQQGVSLVYPKAGARGTASLSQRVKDAMSRTPEGQALMREEAAAQAEFAAAEKVEAELKAKRDSATDKATQGRINVEYARATAAKDNRAQILYGKKLAVEAKAQTFVLDPTPATAAGPTTR